MQMRAIPSGSMRQMFLFVAATMLSFCCNTYGQDTGPSPKLLRQVRRISLDGVEGRIDHFGLDEKHKRLFVSALGNDTVEVVDL